MSSFERYFYFNIGKKIRYYREGSGLTQEQLSQILGVNEKYIGHIERCERFVSTKMLIKIMEFFKVQPFEFFNFDKQHDF